MIFAKIKIIIGIVFFALLMVVTLMAFTFLVAIADIPRDAGLTNPAVWWVTIAVESICVMVIHRLWKKL